MWIIKKVNSGYIEIPEDDIRFVTFLKRGKTVHTFKETYVEALHEKYIFAMTLLEATKIPNFENGIFGEFQILVPKYKQAYIKFNSFTADTKNNPSWL